ncbi:MAG: RIP metalloprotease RseP [bacterium]
MLTTLLSFVFVLALLIFVHELGHFVTAKIVGIRVERFSLGYPPRMIGKKIGDTDYCISWLPLGGYVKMAGMIDESLDDTIKGEPWEFQSKAVWQRALVISAGSFMNLLAALVIFSMIIYSTGIGEPVGSTVGELVAGKPAEAIGLQPGDVITMVNHQPVKTWAELTNIIHHSPGVEMEIEWLRNGEIHTSRVTPELQPERNIGLIGIGPKVQYRDAGLFEAFALGTQISFTWIKLIGTAIKMLITGEESLKSLGGPIIIAKMAGESAKLGLQKLFEFTAIISINLGLLNILPIPVLDGGHLVFLAIEAIRRKPLSIKIRLAVQKIGMAFLLALMVFIIFNDIRNWDRVKELFNF